jgi:hypothetical protein
MSLPAPILSTRRRTKIIAVVTSVALVAAVAIGVPLAQAALSAAHHRVPKPVVMGSYPASHFAAAAAQVPATLTTALARDVMLTPVEYLANSAASAQAVRVVAALKKSGLHVLGSSISGTKLTVNIASKHDAPAVRRAGATPVVGAPRKPKISKRPYHSVDDNNANGSAVWAGLPIFFQDAAGNGYECSMGFSGYTTAGVRQFITAGHCGTQISGEAYGGYITGPDANGNAYWAEAGPVGTPIASEEQFGNGMDYSVINAPTTAAVGGAETWSQGEPWSLPAFLISGESAGEVGATLCKSGVTSGWTCGTILAVDDPQQIDDDNGVAHTVNSIIATTCLLPGDSGGGAMIGNDAVGIDSGSNFPTDSCTGSDAEDTSTFFPMVSTIGSGEDSVQGQLGSNWHIETGVSTPATGDSLRDGGAATPSTAITGTLDESTPTTTITLYLGGSVPYETVSAATGSWRLPLAGIPTGQQHWSVVASDGFNRSRPIGGIFSMTAPCSPPAGTAAPVSVKPAGVGDFNCDGTNDVIARDSSGNLWLYPQTSSLTGAFTGFLSRVLLATNWQGMTAIVSVGDFNGDQFPDVVARDSAGVLWLYPGNGSNGFGARTQLATGWQGMTAIQGVGDFNGDGVNDIVARTASGVLNLYPGVPGGTLGTPIQLATGWQSMTSIVGAGDFNDDGFADIIARDAAGLLWMYPGTSSGSLGQRIQIGAGWQGMSIIAAGDFTHTAEFDLIAKDSSGGLWLYPESASNTFGTRVQIGSGWSGFTLAGDGSSIAAILPPIPATLSGGVGDFNGDGNTDVVVRDGNGTLFLYPGNGGTGFLPRIQLSAVGAWSGMTAIVAAGDLNGDGHPDIVARDRAGTLWLYPGNGSIALGTPEQLGATGAFLGMTAIQGVGDFNGDGHVDLLARDSSGNVLLYPGNGTSTNTLGAPITIATGWGSYTGIMGIGDFDLDGKTDVLARDASGALWLYPGLGSATTAVNGASGGGFGPRVQVGGGWQGITIAAIGDFNKDGTEDIFVRDANGGLWLYPGTGNTASPFGARIQVGGGWQGLTVAGDASSLQAVAPPVPAAVSGGVGDFDGDGNSDVVVRDGNGTLFLYPGNGGTGFLSRISLSATGAWANMTAIVAAGDLNGDGHPDIVGRDRAGTLWLYPGNGSTALGTPEQLGATGAFAGMTAIQGVGDFNGDGHADLLARDAAGDVLLYPGNGTSSNTLGAPITIATGWGSYTGIMGIGDFDGDGKSDVLARDAAGALWLYPGLGSATTAVSGSTGGGFGPRVQVGGGWQGITIQAIGDFNNDGHEDIFVRDANGALWLYPGTGVASSPFLPRIQVGGGWEGLTIAGDAASIPPIVPPVPAAVSGGVGDFDGDGNSDVIVRDGNGTLFLYPGNGGTGFLARKQLGGIGDWVGMTAIVAAGDLNGDGHPDIVGRDSTGTLWLYPNNGAEGFGTRVQLGATGAFAGMTAIQGVGDFNGDGHADLLARDAAGDVLLYPGNGTSATTLGAPITIATGWGSYTGIMGIGDFDGDGKSDVLARDAAGALWLYPGLGSATTAVSGNTGGGFGPRVQVGGGWQGITIQAIGDFNNDGHEDIFVRDANGALWLYPGTGVASNPFLPRIQVGGGWEGLTIAGDAASLLPTG